MQLLSIYSFYYLYLKMEKFVVFGRYCEDAIIKREPFREQHLKRLKNLKDSDILVTLGPTKCTKYLFGIFNANDVNELKVLIEEDIYGKKVYGLIMIFIPGFKHFKYDLRKNFVIINYLLKELI